MIRFEAMILFVLRTYISFVYNTKKKRKTI